MSFLGIEGILKFKYLKKKTGLNDLSFWQIFTIWFSIVLCFGFIYKFLQTDTSYLLNTLSGTAVTNIFDTIYFSFVSATTTGFGDIVPFGFFKLISTLELISGFLILALVTSKLVSMKQEAIMEELYDISFNDKINSFRSSLLLFRQKINKQRYIVEDQKFKKRDIAGVETIISTFEDTLRDIYLLLQRQNKTDFTKKLDSTSSELLFNSVISSFQRLKQFMSSLKDEKIKFVDDSFYAHIGSLLSTLKSLGKEMRKVESKDYNSKINDLVSWFEKPN